MWVVVQWGPVGITTRQQHNTNYLTQHKFQTLEYMRTPEDSLGKTLAAHPYHSYCLPPRELQSYLEHIFHSMFLSILVAKPMCEIHLHPLFVKIAVNVQYPHAEVTVWNQLYAHTTRYSALFCTVACPNYERVALFMSLWLACLQHISVREHWFTPWTH